MNMKIPAISLEKLTGHAALFGASAMWGVMSPVSKMVMAGGIVTPIVMTDCRVLGAAILFWLLSFCLKSEPVAWKDCLPLLLASQCAIVFNQGSFIFGVSLTSPLDASIITTSLPILTLLLSAFFLQEAVTVRKIAGIVSGATGAVLLVTSGHPAHGGNSNIWGDLLIFTAQLSFSVYLIFFRNLISRYSPVTIMKWMFTGASLSLLPFTWQTLWAIDWLALTWRYLAGVAFVVAGGTFVSYLLMSIGQKRLRPTIVSIYNYVQPVAAGVVALMWGMDSLTGLKLLAVALIFGGVFLVTQHPAQRQAEKILASRRPPDEGGLR